MRAARTLQVAIAAPAAHVYEIVATPARLADWSSGIGSAPAPMDDGTWRLETPQGPVRVTFVPRNALGVADHVVEPLEGGAWRVDVPMRVVPDGAHACVVLFTLFRQPGMSDQQFAEDALLVEADLARLALLAERGAASHGG